ncbi:MAG: endonuclease Q family protein [Syntrophomonadaceae bacterium]|nr:endonuclease Q family protein [Syntrophomonadaceae bacterium]
MREFNADLHIHIGSAGGHPVKITASRALTLEQVLFSAAPRKGIHIAGVVDAASTLVSAEIERLLKTGFLADNGVLLIAGSEVECREGAHVIAYLPGLYALGQWQDFIRRHLKNMRLSTQKADVPMAELMRVCGQWGGIFCPAHVFTPHKGAYGCAAERLADLLGEQLAELKVIELGLSADTAMAGLISECDRFTPLSNSDAHSADKVGREYNLLELEQLSFRALKNALEGSGPGGLKANYGMDPRMGKYHRSYCPRCGHMADAAQSVRRCPACGNEGIVMGVWDRILQIRDREAALGPVERNYRYRVPLSALPGVGPKAQNALLAAGSEIEVLEAMEPALIADLVNPKAAAHISAMRSGRLRISPGGGGKYGRVLP